MKKILISILACILIYGLFREINVSRVLFICAAIGSIFVMYRIPSRFIVAAKYPAIILSFIATVVFFFYPHMTVSDPVRLAVMMVSFYALAFYLGTLDEKGKGFPKEAAALSVLFLTTSFNLAIVGRPLSVLSIAISVMLFLYVIGRAKIIPFVAGYAIIIIVLLIKKEIHIFGGTLMIMQVDRYLLLSSTFLLLILAFVGFVGKADTIKVVAFFGLLYVATDILMIVGFKVSGGLLYQPAVSLFLVAPIIGLLLKSERGRA